MRVRLLAGALAAAAVLLYAGVARPLRAQVAGAHVEQRRLREERRTQQSRLALLQRRESRQRALAAAAGTASGQDVVRVARLSMVRSLDETPLKQVRLTVGGSPNRGVAAAVRLSGQGDFDEVVRASGHLIRPGSGLVLSRVQMKPRQERVDLELEAVVPGARR